MELFVGAILALAVATVATPLWWSAAAASTTAETATAASAVVATTTSSLLVPATSSGVGVPARPAMLTPGEVGRWSASAEDDIDVMLLVTLLKSKQMRVYLVQGDVVVARGEGGDQRVVVRPETGEDVGDCLLLAQGLPDGSKRVRQVLHIAEVVCRRRAFLLGGGELGTDLDDPSPRSGGKHALQN